MFRQFTLIAFLGTRRDLRLCLGQLAQPFLAPRQLFRDRHPVGQIGLIRRLGFRHQISHFGLQLGLDLARMLIG